MHVIRVYDLQDLCVTESGALQLPMRQPVLTSAELSRHILQKRKFSEVRVARRML